MGGNTPPPEMEKWFPEFPWKGTHPPHVVLQLVAPFLVEERDLKEEGEVVNVSHPESS